MFVWDTIDVDLSVAVAFAALAFAPYCPNAIHLLGFVECHRNKRDQSCGRALVGASHHGLTWHC
jgi:hypothetical protein